MTRGEIAQTLYRVWVMLTDAAQDTEEAEQLYRYAPGCDEADELPDLASSEGVRAAERLSGANRTLLSAIQHIALVAEIGDETAAEYRRYASDVLAVDGEIEIDVDHAAVSPSAGGAYVQAWVWVDRDDLEMDR